MANRKQSRGECVFCGADFSRTGMEKHLAACAGRQSATEQAERGGRERDTLFHLRVQDESSGLFWLYLEMRGSATLKQLDHYLRAIWLECCGHLSRFSAGGWGGREHAMKRRAAEVFPSEPVLTHTYDFGTSSLTRVASLGVRTGVPLTAHPIALLARNRIPEAECMECGAPATRLCRECLMDVDAGGCTLCEVHAKKHPHDDYGPPIELVNSPRLGACGYEGPADPPY